MPLTFPTTLAASVIYRSSLTRPAAGTTGPNPNATGYASAPGHDAYHPSATSPLPAVHATASSTVSPAVKRRTPIWQQLMLTAIASGVATTATHPIDTCKSRIQLHSATSAHAHAHAATAAGGTASVPHPHAPKHQIMPTRTPTLIGTFASIIRTENPAALYNGLPAALLRVAFYSSTRLGLYEPIKDALVAQRPLFTSTELAPGDPQERRKSFAVKAGAGILSGALAAVIGNPFELTKTRMQSTDHTAYRHVGHALHSIVKEEGVLALWTGLTPSLVRASLFTSVQMVTYEEAKSSLKKNFGLTDESVSLHFAASMVSGLVTTTVINPADVVKTRVMNATHGNQSVLQWTREAMQKGLLMRGWTANYMRLGPQILITLVVYERLRGAMGWDHL